jgi:hypothetical protein
MMLVYYLQYVGELKFGGVVQSAYEGGFKIIDFQNLSISVGDSVAVQKSDLLYEFSGTTYRQKSLTEWRLTRGEWFVVNDIMVNY